MTPDIKPFLLEANRERPELAIANTFGSCMELLALTLKKAGPDWWFVGKSSAMDGGAAHPAWFTPVTLSLQRPDGQRQDVLIDGLSMDAAWYVPARRQVKVIANSTANELPVGDPRRGPARLDPYEISPTNPDTGEPQYRWHNPPIAQPNGAVVQPPAPTPTSGRIPSYEDIGGDAMFRSAIGDALEEDMTTAGQTMNAGSAVWFSRPTFRIVAAFARGEHPDIPAIVKSVRNEWRANLTAQGAKNLPQLP